MTPFVRWTLVALLILGACRGRESQTPERSVADEAQAAFAAGVKHMDAGAEHYDKAVREFSRAAELAPTLWEAHLNVGIVELRRANLSAAATALRKSVDIHASAPALETLGEIYLRQNRSDDAVRLYERALKKSHANDLRLRNRLAVALRHAHRNEEAEAEIRAILGQDSSNADALSTLAAIRLDQGDLDVAELMLNKGLTRHPEHPQLLTNLGLVALARGDNQAAFVLFERASKADPHFLTGRLNRAAVYLGVGDHAKAQEELSFILRIEPGNTAALLGLGVAQRLAGDLKAARTSWQQILKIDDNHAEAHFNLAILEMDFADQPDVAQRHLEQFLRLASKDHERRKDAEERLQLVKALK